VKGSSNEEAEVVKKLKDVSEAVESISKNAKTAEEKSSLNTRYNKAIYSRLKKPLVIEGSATFSSKSKKK